VRTTWARLAAAVSNQLKRQVMDELKEAVLEVQLPQAWSSVELARCSRQATDAELATKARPT
jgi:hypothetical protein